MRTVSFKSPQSPEFQKPEGPAAPKGKGGISPGSLLGLPCNKVDRGRERGVSTAQSVPQGTCLGVLCLPSLPAARAVVAGPVPQRQSPQRSFAAANVRKRSSAAHPPGPGPRPHPRSPTPGGRDLGHPARSRGPEEGLRPRLPWGPRGPPRPPRNHQPAGRSPRPVPRRPPRASLRRSVPGAAREPHLPRRAGPGLGPGAWVTSGWEAPLRPGGLSLSGIFVATKL